MTVYLPPRYAIQINAKETYQASWRFLYGCVRGGGPEPRPT